jgi:hypothetical protein
MIITYDYTPTVISIPRNHILEARDKVWDDLEYLKDEEMKPIRLLRKAFMLGYSRVDTWEVAVARYSFLRDETFYREFRESFMAGFGRKSIWEKFIGFS